jgi:ankyrin repeat protein
MYSTEAAVYSAESLIDPTELCMVGIITENYRLVKEGLARGADVNYNNFVDTPCNPLQKACLKNNIENIKLIINSPHIKINAYKGRTTAPAFHYAMYNDAYKTIVPLFLAHSQKAPNVQNAYGNTMLHIMCKIDNHEKVRYLLSFPHINPNKRNKYGDTPLHIAAAHSATDCIQLLLNHPKTKRLQRNEAGEIPFDKACFSGNIESVKLLLPLYSKRINIKDYHGYTPLHSACHQGSQEKVILLLENSASPTQQNNYQETPLATAFFRLDVNAFNNFYTYNPHYEQLLFNKDKHNNTQLHLAALIYDENILLDEYLVFLISQGLNTWARNDFNETATDIVCKKYNELYHAYKTQRANYLFKAMIKQEATMHSFLRVVSPKTECILFKQVLKHLKLCKDVQKKIAYLYYALNIETIIAQEYFNSKQYYEDFIENKNKIKTRLINNPRSPQLLWWPRYDEIH